MPHGSNLLPISRKAFWATIAGTAVITFPFINTTLHPVWMNMTSRPDRTIIITGATGTLGYSTAYHLARRKCRVIMACRDMERCKSFRRELVLATKNQSIVCRHLDLEDIDSINEFADEMIKTEPHIDVLINNAAVKKLKRKELTKYGIEKHLFVNFLGPYLLTLKLMEKLKESAEITGDSRIVNVIGNPRKSWHVDLLDLNFEKRKYTNQDAYNQSKLALAYFSILLEKINREKRNNVYVFGSSPSSNKTLRDHRHETGLRAQFRDVINEYSHQNASRVCQRMIKCALDPDLIQENRRGKLYNWFLVSLGSNSGWGIAAANEEKAKLTWNVAADLLLSARDNLVKPEEPPKANSTSKTDVLDSDQVKVQGNSKASGVDESA